MPVITFGDVVKIIPWGKMDLRVIEINTLEAMAEAHSGVAHRWTVERSSDNRARVIYSNPDEYGAECPLTAIYPCFNCEGTWWVVPMMTSLEGGRDVYDRDVYGYQNFEWVELDDIINPNEALEEREIIR